MPFHSAEKSLGSKKCLFCEKEIIHKITRDIKRKKFSSHSCRASHYIQFYPKDHFIKMQKAGCTPEINAKKGLKGEKNKNYIKDRSLIKTRSRAEMTEWRNLIFKRDNYTCQHCNQYGGRLEADHILPYSAYPEFRFKLDNGRTLCKKCHKKTDTYAGRAKNYKKRVLNV